MQHCSIIPTSSVGESFPPFRWWLRWCLIHISNKGNAYLLMASWVCNADPIAADLRRLRRTEEPQQRSVHTSHSTNQTPWSRWEHPNSRSPLSREELCLQRKARLINANCMISPENLGRLSALGLKGSCVERTIQQLGNREHLYSCFVRRKPHMMKFKPNQTRTYDGEGFKKRAACLCFKNDREDEVRLRKVQMGFM